jgi:hypothetical protein
MLAQPPAPTLFNETTDFLVSTPTPEAVVEFKPSDRLDQRLHELPDKNCCENLSVEERAELDQFLQINHLLIVALFNPRKHVWADHFRLDGAIVEPLTAKAASPRFYCA